MTVPSHSVYSPAREPRLISAATNPLLKDLRRLAQEPGAYRKLGRIWLEGDHLARALLARGGRPRLAVISRDAWELQAHLRELALAADEIVLVEPALLGGISSLESPAPIGFLIDAPAQVALLPGVATVVLDRLQDAGNVGTVLRSAAALGVAQVVAIKGCAALWSPKVLRAGMGAHFALRLVEGVTAEQLDALRVPLVATSSYAEAELHRLTLPNPCAWVFGHEGQGVDDALMQRCQLTVRIPQPGGEESLNVAAAAAICLYESLRQGG